jgi:hypothetical protein
LVLLLMQMRPLNCFMPHALLPSSIQSSDERTPSSRHTSTTRLELRIC